MVTTSRISREQIAKTVAELLNRLAGDKSPEKAAPDLDVILAWDLDSEDGVELACDLSTHLNIDIPKEDNPLIDDGTTTERKRSRTFCEVVDYLAELASKQQN